MARVRRSQYHQSNASIASQLEHIDWWERNKWSPSQEKHMHGYVKLSGNRNRNRSLWDAWHDRGRAIYGLQGDLKGAKRTSSDALNKARSALSKIQGTQRGLSGAQRDIRGLRASDKARQADYARNLKSITNLRGDFDFLNKRLDNWDTTTDIGDVVGLEDVLGNLKSQYQSDIKDVETQLGDYLKTGDFNTRMTQNLDALGQTLRGEFGDQIGALDIEGVRQAISDQGGDLTKLTEDFAGMSSDMDWIKQLDLGGLDDRINTQGTNLTNLINQQGENFQDQLTNQQTQWKGDLTDLQNILESGRGEALANLESDLGKDRAADLLNLRQQLEEGRLSDIQGMAGNLRQEFGDQVFDLSDTFDQRLGDVQTALGGDISKLFRESGSLQSGLDTLTSGLGTTSQQLEALRDSFGDYKTDAATNLANVQQAFGQQVGDLGTDFTKQLSDLQSSTAEDILGLQSSTAADLLGLSQQTGRDISDVRSALSGDIAGARSEAAAGLAGLTTQSAEGIAGARSEAAEGIAGARSEAAAGLAGLTTQTAKDISEARRSASEGIAGATAEATAGRAQLRSDITAERQKQLSDLDTTWSGRLQAQDRRLQEQFRQGEADLNKRLSDISSSMNYRMLGDSAQGVKIRRSRAYNQGRTRAGTGQLGRSMKISTLNI